MRRPTPPPFLSSLFFHIHLYSLMFILSLPGSLVSVIRAIPIFSDCRRFSRLVIFPFMPFILMTAMVSVLFFSDSFPFRSIVLCSRVLSVLSGVWSYYDGAGFTRLLVVGYGIFCCRFVGWLFFLSCYGYIFGFWFIVLGCVLFHFVCSYISWWFIRVVFFFLWLVWRLSFSLFYGYCLFHSICISSLFSRSLLLSQFLLRWSGPCVCSAQGCVLGLFSSCYLRTICGCSGVWMVGIPGRCPSHVVLRGGRFCLCPLFPGGRGCCCGRICGSGGVDQVLGGVEFFLGILSSGVFPGGHGCWCGCVCGSGGVDRVLGGIGFFLGGLGGLSSGVFPVSYILVLSVSWGWFLIYLCYVFFHLVGILTLVLFLVLVVGVASFFLGWWFGFRHCVHHGGFYCICSQVSSFLVLCGCHPLFLVCFCCPGWVDGGGVAGGWGVGVGGGWGVGGRCLLGLGHGGICSLCRICNSRLGEICMWHWSAGRVPDLSSHPPFWFRPVVCLVLVWLQLRLWLHWFFGDEFQSGVLLVGLILWWGGCHLFCPWGICRFLVLLGIWGCPWVCPLVWCLALWPLSLGIYFSSVLCIWEGLGLLRTWFQCWQGCPWFLDGHGHIGLHCFRALCHSCPPAELLLCWLVLCRVIVPMIWHWQCLWLRYIQFCMSGLFFRVLELFVLRSNLRQVGSGVLGAWGLKVLTGGFFFFLSFGSLFLRFF